jgi:cytochrome P450
MILISFQTVSTLTSFVLLMTLHPDIQRRAQAEIDEVVGKDRPPTPEDRERLPYVCAVIKEVMRFVPVTRLGEILSTLCLYYIHSLSQAFLIA